MPSYGRNDAPRAPAEMLKRIPVHEIALCGAGILLLILSQVLVILSGTDMNKGIFYGLVVAYCLLFLLWAYATLRANRHQPAAAAELDPASWRYELVEVRPALPAGNNLPILRRLFDRMVDHSLKKDGDVPLGMWLKWMKQDTAMARVSFRIEEANLSDVITVDLPASNLRRTRDSLSGRAHVTFPEAVSGPDCVQDYGTMAVIHCTEGFDFLPERTSPEIAEPWKALLPAPKR